jgi:predicted amidohydrolase YtcJ
MEVDGSELRWRIEHAQHVRPDDVPRFGALGVIASVQAVHGTSDGPWIPTRLGEERARLTSQPWRHLFETGAIVTNGTDVPVERIDPIASFYSSVSRMMRTGERFLPGARYDPRRGAHDLYDEQRLCCVRGRHQGFADAGKYADFVVLSQNLLTVEEERIPETWWR